MGTGKGGFEMDTNRIALVVVVLAIVAALAWYLYPTTATAPTAGQTTGAPATPGEKTATTAPKTQ
jgi:hypothetical protein